MQGLQDQKSSELVHQSEIPEGASKMGVRLVAAKKDIGTSKEVRKARMVAQGRTDAKKEIILNDAPILIK